jgi:hypothetical protein
MKTLSFNTTIHADRQKVWEAMTQPETFRQWIDAAFPGSYSEGEWKQGADIRFYGPDKSGTLMHVDEFRPYEYIGGTHTAILQKGGIIDRESEEAKGWIGSKENYTYTENGNATDLTVEIVMVDPAWTDMFNEGWPKALKKLKEICEA